MDRTALVDASPLFGALAPEVRQRIAGLLLARQLPAGSTIYLRGDEATAFYGVAEGRVRFSAASIDGKEVVLDHAGPGHWFGEIGLFDGGPRVVDATAAEATQLFVLPRRDLLALCRSEQDLLMRVVELFSRRIRRAEDIIIDASFLSLPARLAKKLLQLAADPTRVEETPRGPQVRIAQDELGRLAGVTRESAGKQLKNWEREGMVEVDYGRVLLADAARLKKLVAAATGE